MALRRVLALAVVLTAVSGPAYAGGHKPVRSSPSTYDVSYPQCGKALPAPVDGGIVGVNGGVVFSANPCLATEYAWAAGATTYAPAFYANTANPGPAYSSHWPAGQSLPRTCDGTNSVDCSYDYGWNAAKDSFADASAVTAAAANATW